MVGDHIKYAILQKKRTTEVLKFKYNPRSTTDNDCLRGKQISNELLMYD